MSYGYGYEYDADRGYADPFALDAARAERGVFIRKTYLHVAVSVLALIALETLFLSVPAITQAIVPLVFGHWWIAFIGYLLASFIARWWAHSDVSRSLQYAGLMLYTLALSIIFVPLLWYAANFFSPDLLPTAAFVTLLIFAGLTATVMITGKDFSFLYPALAIASMAALGLIIASLIFGFSLGLLFTVGMIVLLSGFILYDTSNVLHHYRTDQYVGAALELFASVAVLFWYVIRLLMILSEE